MTTSVVRPEATPARRDPAATRTVRLALAGCGTVGGALLRLLEERGPAIEAVAGLRFEVTRILVRDTTRRRDPQPPSDRLTEEMERFLDADADVVVEAIGGVEPALTIARHALARGASFVTANKTLIAAAGTELAATAGENGANCAFEAAVAGGVPIVRALRGLLPHTSIRSIRGVLNGTTNYVLTRVTEGATFPDAVREAQELGFAEADPTRDLDGRDAADKIAILAWQAFGDPPDSLHLTRVGLLPDPTSLVDDARSLGGVIRLVAECGRSAAGVTAAVEPVLLPPDSPLARVPGEENLVLLETGSCGTLSLTGPGAGGPPTATALLSDIVAASTAAEPVPSLSRRPHHDEAVPLADRPQRWAVSVRATADASSHLSRAAAHSGVTLRVEGKNGRRRVRAVTGATTRTRTAALQTALAAKGLDPRVVRCEL